MFTGLLLSAALAVAVPTDDRIETGKVSVQKMLKDPVSALFNDLKVVPVENSWVLCGQVRARNGFGGYNEPDFFIAFADEAFLRSQTFGSQRMMMTFDAEYQKTCGVQIVR